MTVEDRRFKLTLAEVGEDDAMSRDVRMVVHYHKVDGSELIVLETEPRESVQKFIHDELCGPDVPNVETTGDVPLKEIGTVEPIPTGEETSINFILGAVYKYGGDVAYHDSLMLYIKGFQTI